MASRRGGTGKGKKRESKKLQLEHLEHRFLLAGEPIINEFLASNDNVLQDEDGEFTDLIELYNQGDQPIDLAGWYLTDDSDDLTKWSFPTTNLAANDYLVVFASGKNRSLAGSELHTNFAISREGEYLALVEPNGTTIASAFSPAFPQQFEDVSYGIGEQGPENVVIDLGSPTKAFVPTSEIGTAWTDESFNDAVWQSGTLGVGYGTEPVIVPSTTILKVDFNDRGNPSNTQGGFDSFVINSGSENQTGSVARNFGAIDVTLTDATGSEGFEDRSRTGPVNSGQFSEASLLQDFVFSHDENGVAGANSGLDVLVEGLDANQLYTVWVWSYDVGSGGARVSDWSANGVTVDNYSFSGGSNPSGNDTHRLGIVTTTNAQGEVLLQGRRDELNSDFAVFLNALQIDTGDTINSPPEVTDVLRLDFNHRTQGEAGSANTEEGYSEMTLDDNGSIFDGIGVTLSAYNGAILNDRDRSVPGENGEFTLDQIFDDHIYADGPAGSGMEILIDGLVPNAQYDVAIRSFDDALSTSPWVATWTEESGDSPVTIADPYTFDASMSPTSNDDNTMRATLTTSPQGTLILRGVENAATNTRSVIVNGIELTRASFEELIGLDLESEMLTTNSSAYIRTPFTIASLAEVDQLRLDMQYDAGFVAYLNGTEVARRNAPEGTPSYDASATTERSTSEALQAETINLDAFIGELNEGSNNVLSIHGLNSDASDTDFLIMPRLRTRDVSSQSLQYFPTPTPGAENNEGVDGFVAEPNLSVDHGFFESSFPVSLSTSTSGADIYYTYDGSAPSPTNPEAMLYTSQITITTTTVLRAAAVKDGFGDSPVATATYLFLDDVLTQDIDPNNASNNPFGLDYPNVWQTQNGTEYGGVHNTPPDYNVDPRIDNDPQWDLKSALQSIPTMSIVLDHEDLWNVTGGIYPNANIEGSNWRRAGSIEYIDPATGENFQYNVGVQMHGAASRDNVRLKKHSFRLIFSSQWDGPGTLEFPLFDNSDFADINTVVMRASFTDSFATRTASNRYSPLDSTYTRDVFMRDTQIAMGHNSPDSTFVHLYINGLYWGMYSPAERTDDAFLASRLGGEREDWDVIRDFNELYRGNRDIYDEMFSIAAQIESANATTANELFQTLQGRNADGSIDPNGTAYLDVDNFIDYILLHVHGGVEDWPGHNWVAARNRVDPGEGFKYFVWDQEISYDGRERDVTNASGGNGRPGELFQRLKNSSEFRQQFADRIQKHMINPDGALTIDANTARWLWRANQVEEAIVGESARWGDAREGEFINVPPSSIVPLITPDHWEASIAEVVGYFPESHSDTLNYLANDDLWYSNVTAPTLSQYGGSVFAGFMLDMDSTAGGTTYYTLNGEDPRMIGGGIDPTASSFGASTQVQIDGTTVVRARTRVGSTWSPLVETALVVGGGTSGVVVSEINFNPYDPTPTEQLAIPGVDNDDFEFVEIMNTNPTDAVNLLNMSLEGVGGFTFDNVLLAPGERAVVVRNEAAFQARYGAGVNVVGEYGGGLSNGGETLEFRDGLGGLLAEIDFNDNDPWDEVSDGEGASLELVDPENTPSEELGKYYRWRSSTEYGGSPGTPGVGPIGVVINEVLSRTQPPIQDKIELFNTTDSAIDISGWYLSDSGANPLKYQIPGGTILAAGAYMVFDESDFNPTPLSPGPNDFALNGAQGDDVYLTIPDGSGGVQSFVDHVEFGGSPEGESLGRTPNGDGRLAPMQTQTFGAENSPPRVGPLIISEVNYHPEEPSAAALLVDPTLVSDELEFIEIYNPTGSTVSLTGWTLRADADYDFAAGTSLAAGETLVVLSFNPAIDPTRANAFRTHYGIDGTVDLVGGFSGHINNSYALLRLERPDLAEGTGLTEDEVLLDDLAPWPTAADGSGSSLQRVSEVAYGNAANGWKAEIPSPGAVAFVNPSADFDGNGSVNGLDFLLWQRGFGAESPEALKSNGDADNDLDVDAEDLSIWESQYGTPGVGAAVSADFDPDGLVNGNDFLIWQRGVGIQVVAAFQSSGDANNTQTVDSLDLVIWQSQYDSQETLSSLLGVDSAFAASQATDEPLISEPSFLPLQAAHVDDALDSAAASSAADFELTAETEADDDSDSLDEAFDAWNGVAMAF